MPALGRIPQLDTRNLSFPAIDSVTATKPLRSYTWATPVHLDQGQTPSCVGHGWTHDYNARPKSTKVVTEAEALALYAAAQALDGMPMPHDGSSVLAGAKAAQAQGWIKSYTWAFNVNDVALAIGYKGPVVMGTDWLQLMFTPDAAGQIHATGPVEGGHCYLLTGVDVKKKLFRIHQSWGTIWGINGDAFISFDDLALLLTEQGEACVPVK